MQVHVRRLLPGTDLKAELDAWVAREGWSAAVVVATVGSLARAAVRFAGAPKAAILDGPFEIVGLSGTLSASGGSHLHIALADGSGRCVGGHLKDGSAVHTTVEIALGVLPELAFTREKAADTGYPELSSVVICASNRPKRRVKFTRPEDSAGAPI